MLFPKLRSNEKKEMARSIRDLPDQTLDQNALFHSAPSAYSYLMLYSGSLRLFCRLRVKLRSRRNVSTQSTKLVGNILLALELFTFGDHSVH